MWHVWPLYSTRVCCSVHAHKYPVPTPCMAAANCCCWTLLLPACTHSPEHTQTHLRAAPALGVVHLAPPALGLLAPAPEPRRRRCLWIQHGLHGGLAPAGARARRVRDVIACAGAGALLLALTLTCTCVCASAVHAGMSAMRA